MTLEEVIKQRLAEAQKQVVLESAKKEEVAEVTTTEVLEAKKEDKEPVKAVEPEEVGAEKEDKEEIVVNPKTKPTLTKEDTVSSQVSALLEAEGLSEEFKEQAVTIFEAAVKDRVLIIKEELQKEFETQFAEAKSEMEDDIDGFLSEAILQWKAENEVAIKSNFKSQVAESFIDGMKALIAEHNIELPEDKEDALEVALKEVSELTEKFSVKDQEIGILQEQVNTLKAEKILESFKSKMTVTEFDRFSQLTESVKFKDEEQYTKQLTVVLENFGQIKKEVKPVVTEQVITEQVADVQIVTESNSKVNAYAQFLSKKH